MPIESATDVMMASDKFCMVTSKLPAEPWYDLGTLDVMKIVAAAKLKSGPNVASATPGIDSAQYDVVGVCGRKKTDPMPKHTMLVTRIQWPGTMCSVLDTIQAARTPRMPLGRRYSATVSGEAPW